MNSKKVLDILMLIFKNILSTIIILLTFITLFLYTLLSSTEKIFYEENITNTIKNIDVVEIIGEDVKNELYTSLEELSVPTEYIDMMLEDEEIRIELSNYAITAFDYLKNNNNDKPELDEAKISQILIDSFDRVLEEANNHDVDVDTYISEQQIELVHTKIKEYTPKIIEKIPQVESYIEGSEEYKLYQEKYEKIKYIVELVKKIFEYKMLLLVVASIFLIILLLLRIKELTFFKWMAMPILLVGIFTMMLSKIIPIMISDTILVEYGELESIIMPTINTLVTTIHTHSIIYLICFGVLTLSQIGLSIYKKRKVVSE